MLLADGAKLHVPLHRVEHRPLLNDLTLAVDHLI